AVACRDSCGRARMRLACRVGFYLHDPPDASKTWFEDFRAQRRLSSFRKFLAVIFLHRSVIQITRMADAPHSTLSRRERQIMDILYRLGRAAANEVMAELQVEPNYSTVRTQLRVLESKGHVRHEEQGLRYVYLP